MVLLSCISEVLLLTLLFPWLLRKDMPEMELETEVDEQFEDMESSLNEVADSVVPFVAGCLDFIELLVDFSVLAMKPP